MSMRMGEMMVVVRAQDFASRTLRRVSAEMAGMSKAQMIAAKRADLAMNNQRALNKVQDAQRHRRNLRIIETRNKLEGQHGKQLRRLVQAEQAVANVSKYKASQVALAEKNLRLLDKEIAAHKALRKEALRNKAVDRRPKRGQVSPQLRARRTEALSALQRARVAPTLPLLSKARDQLNGLEAQASRTGKMLTRSRMLVDQLGPSYMRAAQNAGLLGEQVGKANRRLNEAYNGLTKAQRAQMAFNQAMRQMPIQKLHDVAHALGGVGRTMQLFGAIGTVAFGAAAYSAAQFSKDVTLAATQVTAIGANTATGIKNTKELSDAILQLAKDYPFAASEMAKATYEIFSSTNVDNIKDGINLLDAFSRVAVAGGVDIMTATKASISVLNTFKGASENVGNTLNRMFAIVRFGRMTFSDFAIMLPKVAAAAYGSGQSLDDMAGIMAFLTRKTGSATIAATQISRAFDLFARKEFETGLHAINSGFEGMRDATGKLLPLPQVLGNIIKTFPELAQGGKALERFIQTVTRATDPKTKGLLSTAETRRFFRYVFRDFKLYAQLQKKATTDNEEFQRSFEMMMAAPGTQFDIFLNRLKIAVVQIGNAAIPVFADLGRHIAGFIDWWEKLNDSTKGTAVKWGVLLSVFSLAFGIIFSIVGALGSMILTLGQVGLKVAKFAAGLFGINKALLALRSGAGVLLMVTRLVGFLGAIGVIALALKVAWTGQASAIDFIMGAIAGAGVGFMLGGPAGAVVGAITVPVLLKLIADQPHNPMEKAWAAFQKDQGANPSALSALVKADYISDPIGAYKDLTKYLDSAGKSASITREEFEKQWNALSKGKTDIRTLDPLVVKLFKDYNGGLDKAGKKTKTLTQKWDQWMKGIDKIFNKADAEKIGELLQQALGLEGGLDDAETAMDNMFNATEDRARQLVQVTEDATKTAWGNLEQLYSDLRGANEQLFGELGQGPWLTSETFDLAKEWGVEPGIADLTRDIHDQRVAFNALNADLAKIAKRGGPKALIDALRQMGPEGAGLIDQIANAKPGQFKNLVTEYKKGQAAIDKATKQDFTKTINEFQKAGKDMGQAILDGFTDVGVGGWFEGWISTTFPGLIGAAVSTAVATFNEQNPAAAAAVAGLTPQAGVEGPGDVPVGSGPSKEQTRLLRNMNIKDMNLMQLHKEQKRLKNVLALLMRIQSVRPLTPAQQHRLSYVKTRLNRITKREQLIAAQQYPKPYPQRALGGTVRRGQRYLVGERGPEMFMANRSGRIMSNRATEGAASNDSSKHITLNYNIQGGTPGDKDRARRDAFVIKQRMKGWI